VEDNSSAKAGLVRGNQLGSLYKGEENLELRGEKNKPRNQRRNREKKKQSIN
jgi:hypothetical protein